MFDSNCSFLSEKKIIFLVSCLSFSYPPRVEFFPPLYAPHLHGHAHQTFYSAQLLSWFFLCENDQSHAGFRRSCTPRIRLDFPLKSRSFFAFVFLSFLAPFKYVVSREYEWNRLTSVLGELMICQFLHVGMMGNLTEYFSIITTKPKISIKVEFCHY